MAEEYQGRVAFVVDPETGKGRYIAMPDADWEDTGDPLKNEQHPDSLLTEEELLALPEVVWVSTPETLEEIDLPPQTVSMRDYAAGSGGQVNVTNVTPEDQEGFTELPNGEYGYTFGARKTQAGGGHFELASDQPSE